MIDTQTTRRRAGLILTALLALGLSSCSEPQHEALSLSPETLLTHPPAEALILDVRSPEEFAQGHVPGARNIPHDQLEARLAELGSDRGRNLVVYCESGRRAGIAEGTLLAAGFSAVHHLEGDMKAWREAGRPSERNGAR
jgi:rhodanese-related sulfurtransferase